MLRLRKILLLNYVYYIFLIISLLIVLLTVNMPKISKYHPKETEVVGVLTSYHIDSSKLSLTLKGKEKLIGTYYFFNKKELDYFQENIKIGDHLKLTGKLIKPTQNTTKNLFNYQKYLLNKKIFYQISIESITKIKETKRVYYKIKQLLIERLNKNPYLHLFILGDKSYLSNDIVFSFQEIGISHLFAISGMHITLLSSIILKILKKLKISENKRYFITSIFLIIFLLIANTSPSILRGVLFFILFSLNKIYYFHISPINLYIFILSLTLLINPLYIFDIGFKYSFLISGTLIILSNYLHSSNYFISLFKVSFISNFISFPITIKNFYQINILSIFLNIIYVPFISLIVFPLALISLFIKKILPIFTFFTNLLEKTSLYFSSLSIFKLSFVKLPSIIYIIYFILIVLIIFSIIKKKKKTNKSFIVIFILFLIFHINYNFFIPSTYLKLIDIGQGDSILLHNHTKDILIDTGGLKTYYKKDFEKQKKEQIISNNITLPLLRSLGIRKLDYIFITHGDDDHIKEAFNITKNFNVDKVILNSNNLNQKEQSLKKMTSATKVKENECFLIHDLTLCQLNKDLKNENDSSQIILIFYKNKKILLMGDASIKSEEILLNNYEIGKVNILKLGHHGSKTSTSDLLLKMTSPDIALISAGENNKFNHPHPTTVKKIQKYKIKYYSTILSGTITIDLDTMEIFADKKSNNT